MCDNGRRCVGMNALVENRNRNQTIWRVALRCVVPLFLVNVVPLALFESLDTF